MQIIFAGIAIRMAMALVVARIIGIEIHVALFAVREAIWKRHACAEALVMVIAVELLRPDPNQGKS